MRTAIITVLDIAQRAVIISCILTALAMIALTCITPHEPVTQTRPQGASPVDSSHERMKPLGRSWV